MPEVDINGYIALRYSQPADKYIRVGGEGVGHYREYLFKVGAAGVSLAWIIPSDIPEVLKIMGGCCNSQAPLFHYANAEDVRIWTGRPRPGEV